MVDDDDDVLQVIDAVLHGVGSLPNHVEGICRWGRSLAPKRTSSWREQLSAAKRIGAYGLR